MMRSPRPAAGWFGDAGGLAAIEFAFIAPLLILAYFAVAELCAAMLAQRKTSHVASAIGDLTTQYSTLQPSDVSNIFAAGQVIMSSSPATGLKMRISVVQENAAGTAASVLWSCASSNWTPLAKGTPEALQPNLITASQSVVMAEAKSAYSAPISTMLPSAFNYSDVFYLRPRIADPIPAPGC
jgi:Flp pilus assembly protein TadG